MVGRAEEKSRQFTACIVLIGDVVGSAIQLPNRDIEHRREGNP